MQFISPDHLRNIKYYNDITWYYMSMIGIIPLFMITFYKLYFPIVWDTRFNKLKKNVDDYFPTNLMQDKLAKIFLFYALVYYPVDVFITLATGRYDTGCRFFFTCHHILSLILCPLIYFMHHYQWFVVGVPAFHGVLLMFPQNKLLNYPYLLFIIAYIIGIHTKPFCDLRNMKILRIITYVLIFVLFFLDQLDCTNTLPETDF